MQDKEATIKSEIINDQQLINQMKQKHIRNTIKIKKVQLHWYYERGNVDCTNIRSVRNKSRT